MSPQKPATLDRWKIHENMAYQFMFVVLNEKRARQALNRVKRRLHGV